MKRLVVAVLLVLSVGATALAQRGGYFNAPAAGPSNPRYDGRFMFARLKYTVGPNGYYYQGMPAWAHGEPFAGENLMKIMEAVSSLQPHIEKGVTLSITDPELFKFPVAYMAEAGYWVQSEEEVTAMRAYLQKGGFIIFDDFREGRGSGGWDNFAYNMQRVIPGAQFVPMDISHPIFHAFYEIPSFDVIPQAYDSFGGRGRRGGGGFPTPAEFYGLFENNDPSKRMLAIINYNTDLADFWEFSGSGIYPIDESNEAYKLGVNYIIYGIMH